MKTFSGFPPGKVRSVNVPEPVFTDLIPLIDDLAELKLTLHVLWRLLRQRGKVRYLSYADLASDDVLRASLGDVPADALRQALARAVERGTLLRVEAAAGDAEIADRIRDACVQRGFGCPVICTPEELMGDQIDVE